MKIKFNNQCRQAFIQWLEAHPPKRFSRQLRHVIFQFIEDEARSEVYTLFLPEFLAATQELFDVLDMIEDTGLSDKELMDTNGGCFINDGYQGIDYFGGSAYLSAGRHN